ncbi:MAG: 16S rRNA (uracil(1498)-N(3))-methyltransferase [Caulobacterales bacterium]
MIRLFVSADLATGALIDLPLRPAHYLVNVMRLAAADELLLFNGRDGEWRARVTEASKRACRLAALEQTRAQPQTSVDLDLAVALVKRTRLETIVEKAAELGARRVLLTITERTNAERTRVERLQAIATEAAEQTGRLDVPEVIAPLRLSALLDVWPAGRPLMFCDEAGDAPPAPDALAARRAGPWTILIGPEGGFSPAERARIRALPDAVPVSLGPRILRADTAAIAALSLWQAALGDWRA